MSEGSPKACLNCGAELQGVFCHRCGQKDQHRRVPLKHLLHDVVHDLWHFDAKVLGSLWLLIKRPGFLAAEYLDGRRVRHVPPFRMYVVVSFIVFALLAWLGKPPKVSVSSKKPANVVTLEDIKVETGQELPPETAATVKKLQEDSPSWAKELNRRGALASKNPDLLKKAFLAGLSKVMFLLMPLFAALLFLMHARKGGTLFVDHMVLSLHFHTVAFIGLLAIRLLVMLPDSCLTCFPLLALFLAPLAWLAAALQHLHRRGWGRSILKSCLVLGVYGFCVGIALLTVLYFSLPH